MKIIASDFDGTINYRGVSEADRNAIKRFREAGNKFGIVTGRDLEAARWILFGDKMEIDFLITCTGALITDGCGKIVYEDAGEVGEFMKDLTKEAAEFGAWALNIVHRTLKYQVDITGAVAYEHGTMKKFNHCNTWLPSEEDAEKFCKHVNEKYGDKISACQNGRNVDMPPYGNSKTTGIYKYASQFDNPKIYTVGDNFNDIPMLKEFDSFAVSNACDEVKKVAKHTCERVCDMIDFILSEDE